MLLKNRQITKAAAVLVTVAFLRVASAATPDETVDLAPSQLNAITIAPIGTASFAVEKTAVGSIDYNEDVSVPVFSPYQGKIIKTLVDLGDQVQKGQLLYTIDSPDLIQAESTLIGVVASSVLYSNELVRATSLAGTNGLAQRELEQATSDAQTAEGALKAARDVVRLFGKTDAQISQIETNRKIDPVLDVRSPVTGRVITRNAQPGLLVQPGNAPAPYSVADLSTKWLLANISESGSPLIRLGQPVKAQVMAYPTNTFEGKISAMGEAVDPNTHRLMVRCAINDTENQLRPGMLVTFTIQVKPPEQSVAIPVNGVVRNGDGTMAAWVTADRHRFSQRIIAIGLQDKGLYQVLDGLRPGDLAVTDGAIFLSNILYAPPSD